MLGRRGWTSGGIIARARLALLAVGIMAVPALAGPITYIYDELGRLAAAVDPAAQTAVYSYDAVGNITAITNRASSQVAVITFSPGCGGVGATVLIDGTGFSTTPASNTVKFNGTTATVTAATFTEITATVPAGATTGTVSVTAPGGSSTSVRSFTVGCGAPTITSFTPSIALTAASVTVTGTNFDTTPANDQVLFNIANGTVNTASATSLGVTVPPTASSGHLTVTTPTGTAVSTADFFVPPPGKTVADIDTTGRVTLGTGQAISTSNTLKVHLRVFDGTTGHRAFVGYTKTAGTCSQVTLLLPNGVSVATGGTNNGNCDPVGFIDPEFLPFSSSYTVAVTATNNNSNVPTTGTGTLTVYDVVDQTGTITPGGAGILAHLPTPGQRALLTFSATAGQVVTALGTGVTIPGLPDYQISVLDPFNVALNFSQSNTPNWLERTTIVTTGTHTVLVDPRGAASGDATITLYNVPADVSGSTTVNGSTVALTTTVPGQNGFVTFPGTSGQSVSVKFTSNTFGNLAATGTLYDPGAVSVTGRALFAPTDQFGPLTLASTGTYKVYIDPSLQVTGGVTIQVPSP